MFLHTVKRFIPTQLFRYLQPVYHFVFAWLAAVYYRHPSRQLIVIGVTGTTGKSTIIHLIAKTLEHAGYNVGYTSTALFKIGEREWNNDKKMTMLGRFFTQRMLRKMVAAGCHYAIIETTSQGIEQFRHRFINYDVAVFTGLYPEHIDAHGSFENYKQAKGKLFTHLTRMPHKHIDENRRVVSVKNELKKIEFTRVKKVIVVNGNDEHAEYFLHFTADEKIAYRTAHIAQRISHSVLVEAQDVVADNAGVHFTVDDTQFDLNLMGSFNVSNALAAYATVLMQGVAPEQIKAGLEVISGVPGRFERIDEGQDFTVIVDYAFEPNAVRKLYETIQTFKHERVIHVLGSTGGGRDVSRRAVLGRIAGEQADIVIITNEDPYDDDPQIIIDQVALGAEKAGKTPDESLLKILDRREAISRALSLAQPGDVVLITGKGNEQAICVEGGKLIPWDDRSVAREELQKIKKPHQGR